MEKVTSGKRQNVPAFDEIVFDHRNKEYGAFVLRRQYRRNVIISLFLGLLIMAVLVIIPFLNARANDSNDNKNTKEVNVIITAMEKPLEKVVIPEKPPQSRDEMKVDKYVPPEVVDSVSDKDLDLMTADEAWEKIQNDTVMEIPTEIATGIDEPDKSQEPFIVVEEPPAFPGGLEALLKYVALNVVYPEISRENNIQGRVIVKFCVTPTGGVSMISILKGIDPELDKEAMRVVSTLPAFKPGKQGGRPVPVWFMLPVLFKLETN